MIYAPPGDLQVFWFFNRDLVSPFLDVLMPLVSLDVLQLVIALIFGLLGFIRVGKKFLPMAALIIAIMGVSELSTLLIKNEVGRVRPFNALADARFMDDGIWQTRPADFIPEDIPGNSFPSAHSANSMALALAIALIRPSWRPWIFIMPLLVGLSRIYLAKHYPSDVLSGWILGTIVALLIWRLWFILPPSWRPDKKKSP